MSGLSLLSARGLSKFSGDRRILTNVTVAASHDRVFLDQVCTAVLDLEEGRDGITRYGGSYSDCLTAKRVERLSWEEQYAAEQDQLDELRASVRTTARQVNHDRAIKDNNKIAYDRHAGARARVPGPRSHRQPVLRRGRWPGSRWAVRWLRRGWSGGTLTLVDGCMVDADPPPLT